MNKPFFLCLIALLAALTLTNLNLMNFPSERGISVYDFSTDEQKQAKAEKEEWELLNVYLRTEVLSSILCFGAVIFLLLGNGVKLSLSQIVRISGLVVLLPVVVYSVVYFAVDKRLGVLIMIAPPFFIAGVLLYYFGIKWALGWALPAGKLWLSIGLGFLTGIIAMALGLAIGSNITGRIMLLELILWGVTLMVFISYLYGKNKPVAQSPLS